MAARKALALDAHGVLAVAEVEVEVEAEEVEEVWDDELRAGGYAGEQAGAPRPPQGRPGLSAPWTAHLHKVGDDAPSQERHPAFL